MAISKTTNDYIAHVGLPALAGTLFGIGALKNIKRQHSDRAKYKAILDNKSIPKSEKGDKLEALRNSATLNSLFGVVSAGISGRQLSTALKNFKTLRRM